MERLVKEYIELLSGDGQASDKFQKLDKRIKQDKRRTGVLARDVKRSNMFQLIIDLIYEEAISKDDLRAPLKISGCPQAQIFHSLFLPKLLVIRQYDFVVLTIIYYKISAPLHNFIFLEVPLIEFSEYLRDTVKTRLEIDRRYFK